MDKNISMKKLIITIALILVSIIISSQNYTVVLDASHGGKDKGASAIGLNESDFSLQLVKEITKELNSYNAGINVVETRTKDELISLNERVNTVNNANANLLISFHINNSNNTNEEGIEFYYPKDHNVDESKLIANNFTGVFTQFGFKLRDIKPANFAILKNTNCPAFLVEIGFLSNEKDRKLLTNTKEMNYLAKAIAKYILASSTNAI